MIDTLTVIWSVVASVLHILLASAVTVHAVLFKRDSRAVIGWVGLAWLAPFFGAAAYFSFGINRIQRKAISLKLRTGWQETHTLSPTDTEVVLLEEVDKRHPELVGLATLGKRLTGRLLLPGNRVTPLIDGDEAYPAMLEAIRKAEHCVALSTYIFDSDRAGDQFLDALTQATQRGIEVRVLIDHVGSRYSKVNMIGRLQKSGVKAAGFLPTRAPRYAPYANLRNHRKLLIVDGRVAFTGGTNIREGHCLKLKPKAPVQCLHFQFDGPVAWHLQEAFAVDWAFATHEVLSGEPWFPEIERDGDVWARGIDDGPDEDYDKLGLTMVGGLAAAQRSADIITPYFLPDVAIIQALNTAALRGVRVRIILPSKNNIPIVHWASRAQWWQMLERGCEIYLSDPPFDHTKTFVVDETWALLGSTNWDPRSLRLNFEFNVECYNPALACKLTEIAERKLSQSHQVTLDEVNSRSLPVRLKDGLARLASPYL